MTYAAFKDIVASYMNRTAASLVTPNAVDMVLTAMNDARRSAQREYTFNLNSRTAFVQLSLLKQSLLTDFDVDPSGSGALVIVKRVDKVFEYASALVGATTCYYPTATLPFYARRQMDMEVPISATVYDTSSTMSVILNRLNTFNRFAYLQGVNILHSQLTTPTWYMCDVVEFLPEHAGDGTVDIFLTYFVDWLKFATIANLNVYLKDSERFPIDSEMMNTLWESVKQFDAQQAVSTDSNNLD